mgnify:FL=1
MARKTSAEKEICGKIIKKIPVSENGCGVQCSTRTGQRFLISQNIEKMKFVLWRMVDGGYEKITVANSPFDLYDIIPWEQ